MPEPTGEVVGREPELSTLATFLERVPSGPSFLLIEGDPGIGKTTLWKEGVRAGAKGALTVLQSRPAPTETAWSFSGLGDLLRDVIDSALPQLPDVQRRALEGALLIGDPAPTPDPLAVSLATLGVLRMLCSSGPVLACIDDMNCLDQASSSALDFALRRMTREPIGVLATTRPRQPVLSVFSPEATPDARAERLTLGPLTVEELDLLLRGRVGSSLGALVPELHRTTAGNPFYAVEIGRLIVSGEIDVRPGEPLPVPPSLRDLVMRRLEGVPRSVRRVLLVVAICANPTVEVVEGVLGTGEETDQALERAVSADLLELEGGRLRLAHPLVGSVLQGEAPPGLLRTAHGKLADAVADPEERARHLARSLDRPDPEAAARLEAGARASRARGAPGAAAELAEAALRLTPSGDQTDAARRTILAAEYLLDAGNTARSRALLESIEASMEPGPLRASALQRLGWVVYREESWAKAARLFDAALQEVDDDASLRASIELDASLPALLSGDLQQAASRAEAALESARDLPDPAMESRAAAVVGSIDFLMGRGIPDRLMQRALEDETWARPAPTLEHPSVAFGVVLKMTDDLEGARKRLLAARSELERAGNERSLPFILFHLAELECWSGNLHAAEQHASDASHIALRTGQEATRSFTLYAQALVAAYRGQVQEAIEAADRGLAAADLSGAFAAHVPLTWVKGFVEISQGNVHRAVEHLEPLAEDATAIGIHEPGALRWVGDAMEAFVAAGKLDQAEDLIEAVERRASELNRTWGRTVSARSRGLLEAARDEPERGLESLEVALEAAGKLGQPFELGRTLLAMGTIQRRLKRRKSARETLERSLEVFESLGTPLWADKARAELSRIGGRAPSSLELTPTERKIADAVAQGATNDEVARALFMTTKTVEWNLTRIYRKVGVRSRTELARWLEVTR